MLASEELRGNAGVQKCIDFADQLMPAEIKMFINILENKTRLGIGATDINKLCKLFKIEQFEVMFAQQYKKVKNIDWTKEHYIQPKIDGMRDIGIKKAFDAIKFYTRTGKPITSLRHLEQEVNEKMWKLSFVMDGEIESGASLEETGAIRRKDEQAEDAVYTLFGIYNYEQWMEKNHKEPYFTTYAVTRDLLEDYKPKGIRLIPTYRIKAKSEEEFHELVTKYYQEFLEQGYEGAVLKTTDHVYQPSAGSKRSNDWIKIKPEETTEGIITEIIEGEGQHQGLVGKFMVKWVDATFEVAPGNLNHESRKRIWDNKEAYLGSEIEFKYQVLSIYGVPRHASAIKIRNK
jgi:ATP-dependent DNA ligase